MSYKKYIAIPLDQLEFVRGEQSNQEAKIEEKIEEKKVSSSQEPVIEEKQELPKIVKKRKRREPPGIRAKKWIQF